MSCLRLLRNLHVGASPLAILGNGSSLLDHDLTRVGWSIGTNRSWQRYISDYHVTVERDHARRCPEFYRNLPRTRALFVAGEGWNDEPATKGRAIVLPIIEPSRKGAPKFSRDLEQGVVVSMDGVGSVVYVAIQIAAYMGFSPIYLLGVDLGGEHFHKEWPTSKEILRQNELFKHVPSDVEVYVVGSPESKALFPKRSFEEVFGG